MLGDNRRMLDVFRDSGFAETVTVESGVCHVVLSLAVTEHSPDTRRRRSQSRRDRVDAAVLRAACRRGRRRQPRPRKDRIGNSQQSRRRRIHRHDRARPSDRPEIGGLTAYPRVADIPGPVDLAIIVVPADEVLAAVDDCISKNVPAICVISAGFSECDAEGRAREAMLLDKVRRAGCRLIGPNCMGLLNTDPAVRLNATFSPVYPPRGSVAMSTQSGALGLAILDYAKRLDIGISSFVSVGNKADVSGNDLIQYWADDPNTVGHPAVSRELRQPEEVQRDRPPRRPDEADCGGEGRPLGGRIARGRLAHRRARLERRRGRRAVQAGWRHPDRAARGDVRRGSAAVASAGARGPAGRDPDERRRAGHSGGRRLRGERAAAPAAERDDASRAALVSARRGQRRQSRRHAGVGAGRPLPPGACAILRDDERRQRHRHLHSAARHRAERGRGRDRGGCRRARRQAGARRVHARRGRPGGAGAHSRRTPSPNPRPGARAGHRVWSVARQRVDPGSASSTDSIATAIRRIVDAILHRGGGWALPDEALALLAAAGIETAASRVATDVEAAAHAAADLGFPVALKALGPTLLHKTERRAVCLNLATPRRVRAAYADFATRFGGDMTAVLVQQMVPPGVEMIVGALQDPLFGPLIACGTGGVLVDILADTAFRLHPLTASDAVDMIDELRGARLLRGYRGSPPADEKALRDVLLRVSELVTGRARDSGARSESCDRPVLGRVWRMRADRRRDPDRRRRVILLQRMREFADRTAVLKRTSLSGSARWRPAD